MKVLIISAPRCGSTSLSRAISTSYGLKKYEEPYNFYWGELYESETIPTYDCVVKCMSYEKLPKWNTAVEFLTDLSKEFTHVICLDRRNFQEQNESFSYMRQKRYDGPWQKPYIFDEKTTKDIDFIRDEQYLKTLKDNVHLVAKNIGIKVTYHEDIFCGDEPMFLYEMWKIGLDIDYSKVEKFINRNNKLRINRSLNSNIL